MLLGIQNWGSPSALSLYERVVTAESISDSDSMLQFDAVAAAAPQTGCRLICLALDRVLAAYRQKRSEHEQRTADDAVAHFVLSPSLHHELDTLNNYTFGNALAAVSQQEPGRFLHAILPWMEDVLALTPSPDPAALSFHSDMLAGGIYETILFTQYQLMQAIITALTTLASSDPRAFRAIVSRLASLPYQTPQELVAHVYQGVAAEYLDDALTFLLADRRRMSLGDNRSYTTRRLITAICPLLGEAEQAKLEAFILTFPYVPPWLGVKALRLSGIDQLGLLQSLNRRCVTDDAQLRLRLLERKFPGYRASDTPAVVQGGMVESPIAADVARKMSDRDWRRAMRKYHGGVQHRDALRGGAHELSGELVARIVAQPDRFFRLLRRLPDDIDDAYVGAYLSGLADATVPADWLFSVVRRFAQQPGRSIRQAVAWALQKRAVAGLPHDLLALLEADARDRSRPVRDDKNNPYNAYLNSDRGAAFGALMDGLRFKEGDDALARRWELVEYAAGDPSLAIRAGAIENLLYLLSDDRPRAIAVFERAMQDSPALLRSQCIVSFINHGRFRHIERMIPYIQALLESDYENNQQWGSELVCSSVLSTTDLGDGVDWEQLRALARTMTSGPVPWRRGAARVYAGNIADAPEICARELMLLFEDDNMVVRSAAAHYIKELRSDQIIEMKGLVDAFANSPAVHDTLDEFATFVLENASLDLSWATSLLEAIITDSRSPAERSRTLGIEGVIRATLKIYAHPLASEDIQRRTMNVFDALMERFGYDVHRVLDEWDRV